MRVLREWNPGENFRSFHRLWRTCPVFRTTILSLRLYLSSADNFAKIFEKFYTWPSTRAMQLRNKKREDRGLLN